MMKKQNFYPLVFLFAIVITIAACQMSIEIIKDGIKYGAVVEIELEEEEEQTLTGTNIFGERVEVEAAGAKLEVGVKPESGVNFSDLCPEGNLVWRQWRKANISYYSGNHNAYLDEDKWYPDLGPNGRNLPTAQPTQEERRDGFDHKFVDRPAVAVSIARDGDFEWEAITCFGCDDGASFEPLACFKWGYTMDEDGDIDTNGPEKVEPSEVKEMSLP